MESNVEFAATCPKCSEVYWDERRWNFCPICGRKLNASAVPVRPLGRSSMDAYTVAEAAARTGLSRQTITRLFEDERGVIVLKRPEKLHKRGYRSIRIPRPVYERVIARLAVR